MLEESKIEVRELREQLSVLTNKRLKCENELQNTNRALENTEQRAKMLGIGAWEGTHDIDVKTRKITSEVKNVAKQVDTVEEYTGTLQLLKDRAKNSIGDLPTQQKFLIQEINMYKHELYAAQMQKLHAVRESNKEESFLLELEKTASELEAMQHNKMQHLRAIFAAEEMRRERNNERRKQALQFAQSVAIGQLTEEEIDHLYHEYQQGAARIATMQLRLKTLKSKNRELIEGFELMKEHANVASCDLILEKFLDRERNYAQLSKTRDERMARLQELKKKNIALLEQYKLHSIDRDSREAYKLRRQRLDQEATELEDFFLKRKLEDSTKKCNKMTVLSEGLDNMLDRCITAFTPCLQAKLKTDNPTNRRGSLKHKLKGKAQGITAALGWKKNAQQANNDNHSKSSRASTPDSSQKSGNSPEKDKSGLQKRSLSRSRFQIANGKRKTMFKSAAMHARSALSWLKDSGKTSIAKVDEGNEEISSSVHDSRGSRKKLLKAKLKGKVSGIAAALNWQKSARSHDKDLNMTVISRTVILAKLKYVMESMVQINNEVLEIDVPDKSDNTPKIELSYSQLADDIGKTLDISGKSNSKIDEDQSGEGVDKSIPRLRDLDIKTRRLSQRISNKNKANVNILQDTHTIPSGASLYSILSTKHLEGAPGDHQNNGSTSNIRVSATLAQDNSTTDLNDFDNESNYDVEENDIDPPEWLQKVTKDLLQQHEDEKFMDTEVSEISSRSDTKKKRRRNTTIVIGHHFPPTKPAVEEETIITREKIKQMSQILVKKHNIYEKISRTEPDTPRTLKKKFNESSNVNDVPEGNRDRPTKGRGSSSTHNELKLLSGSWTKKVKENIVDDASAYLDDLHKEMEIKEKIMRRKERARRDSIKPIAPLGNIAAKARRPTQSPNKARRRVSNFRKTAPKSLGERPQMRKLQASKRHSALLIRRRRTMAKTSKPTLGQKLKRNNSKQNKDSKQKLLSIVT